jgi:hypothetical protein
MQHSLFFAGCDKLEIFGVKLWLGIGLYSAIIFLQIAKDNKNYSHWERILPL